MIENTYIINATGTDSFVGENAPDEYEFVPYTTNTEHALAFPNMLGAAMWAFMHLPVSVKWNVTQR
jgi:hypothetical protein